MVTCVIFNVFASFVIDAYLTFSFGEGSHLAEESQRLMDSLRESAREECLREECETPLSSPRSDGAGGSGLGGAGGRELKDRYELITRPIDRSRQVYQALFANELREILKDIAENDKKNAEEDAKWTRKFQSRRRSFIVGRWRRGSDAATIEAKTVARAMEAATQPAALRLPLLSSPACGVGAIETLRRSTIEPSQSPRRQSSHDSWVIADDSYSADDASDAPSSHGDDEASPLDDSGPPPPTPPPSLRAVSSSALAAEDGVAAPSSSLSGV